MASDRAIQSAANNGPILASQLDHNALLNLTVGDVHTQYAFLTGRAGGQSLVGGTGASDALALRGTSNADLGQITTPSQMIFESGWGATTPAANIINYSPTATHTGFVAEAVFRISPVYTISNIFHVYQAFVGGGTWTSTVEPNLLFSVWILFSGSPIMTSDDAAIHAIPPTIYSAQPTIKNDGLGATWVGVETVIGFSFSPTFHALNAADIAQSEETTAVRCVPTWNVPAATALAQFGTVRGLHCQTPEVIIFGSSTGLRESDNYYGLAFDNILIIPTPAAGRNVVVHSDLVANAKNLFLRNEGGARSELEGDMEFVGSSPAGRIIFNSTGGTGHILFGLGPNLLFNGAGPNAVFNNVGPNLLFNDITGPHIQVIDGGDELEIIYTGTTMVVTPGASAGGGSNSWDLQFKGAGDPAGAPEHHKWGGSADCHWDYDRISFGGASPLVPGTTSRGSFVFEKGGAPFIGTTDDVWSDIETKPGQNVNINGRTNVEVNTVLLNPPTWTLSGGTIADESQLRINGMGTDGTRQQGLWCDGARARVDGKLNLGAEAPSNLTGDQNNYTGLASGSTGRTVLRMTSDASRTITGIVPEQDNDCHWLVNVGANDIVLADQNVSSSVANRIISPTGADLTIQPEESACLWYDPIDDRWRILFTTGA